MKLKEVIILTCVITITRCSRETESEPIEWNGRFNLKHNNIARSFDDTDVEKSDSSDCMCFKNNKKGIYVSNYLKPDGEELERLVIFLYRNKNVQQTSIYIPNQQKQSVFPELTEDESDIIIPNAVNVSIDNIFERSFHYKFNKPSFTNSKFILPIANQQDYKLQINDFFNAPVKPLNKNVNSYYKHGALHRDNNFKDLIYPNIIVKTINNKQNSNLYDSLNNVDTSSFTKKMIHNIPTPFGTVLKNNKLLFEQWFRLQMKRLEMQVHLIFSPSDVKTIHYLINKLLEKNSIGVTDSSEHRKHFDISNLLLLPVFIKDPNNLRFLEVHLVNLLQPHKVLGKILLRNLTLPTNLHPGLSHCKKNQCKLNPLCKFEKCTPKTNLGRYFRNENVSNIIYVPWPKDDYSHIITPISNMIDSNDSKYTLKRNFPTLFTVDPRQNLKNNVIIENYKRPNKESPSNTQTHIFYKNILKPWLSNNNNRPNKNSIVTIKRTKNHLLPLLPMPRPKNHIKILLNSLIDNNDENYNENVPEVYSITNNEQPSFRSLIKRAHAPATIENKIKNSRLTKNGFNIQEGTLPIELMSGVKSTSMPISRYGNNILLEHHRLGEDMFTEKEFNTSEIESGQAIDQLKNVDYEDLLPKRIAIPGYTNELDFNETELHNGLEDVEIDEIDELHYRILGGQAATSSGTPVANKGRSGDGTK